MKKYILFTTAFVITGVAATLGYLIFTERLLFRPPILYSDDPLVTYTTGTVKYTPPGVENWQVAKAGVSLPEGFIIRTERGARADIRFSPTIVVRLSPYSVLTISKANIKNKIMGLQKGAMYGLFKREYQDQSIKITTPTSVASVRGTELGFEVFEMPNESKKERKKALLEKLKARDRKAPEDPALTEEAQQIAKLPDRIPATRVYAVSGIVGVNSLSVPDSELLLSFQTESVIAFGEPPTDPEKIEERKSKAIRNALNSLHFNEVLVISEKILFDTDSAKLKTISQQELDRIAAILKTRKENVRIEGHTDNTGKAHYNQALSVRRALAIKKDLVGRGVPAKRLSIAGYGSSRPIVENDSEMHRQQNRRVEFVIVD